MGCRKRQVRDKIRANALLIAPMTTTSQPLCTDRHTHVFAEDSPVIPTTRHKPAHDASLTTLLQLQEAHGVTHAVLTGPSFFGSNNEYLLDALRCGPQRRHGTVIVAPGVTFETLKRWDREGVVGIHQY